MPDGSSSPSLPRWNLEVPYPGLESPGFRREKDLLRRLVRRAAGAATRAAAPGEEGRLLLSHIEAYNRAAALHEKLSAYAYMHFSTDTGSAAAARELEALDTLALPLRRAETEFRVLLGEMKTPVAALLRTHAALRPYGSFLREQRYLSKRQMTPDLEELAADLALSGADAWERLQQAVSAGVSMEWSKKERKTLVELRSLASHRDRTIREKAYRLELAGWEGVTVPLGFALNGVKGFSISLNRRRGWRDTLEKTVRQSRMSPASFRCLLEAMNEALPVFRRYYRAKAWALGLPKLAFFDLFAPLGKEKRRWTFPRAVDYIAGKFSLFSPDLGDFARRAAVERWIDAEPRKGKIGGAYCIGLGGESRIFCNFDGTFSSVSTLAHELGHAYHHEVLKDAAPLLRSYPMTLAETASIFSETIVMDGALETAPPEERLYLVEQHLQDSGQVVVDILSRFNFEKELFARRERGSLSPEDLSLAMRRAQRETYGPVLDEEYQHPYMWAVKGHYYRQDLAFYNFPYAFGLLFALGLAARYRTEGPGFAAVYRKILAAAGSHSAVETARLAGFDLETPGFWRAGVEKIAGYVDIFEGMVKS